MSVYDLLSKCYLTNYVILSADTGNNLECDYIDEKHPFISSPYNNCEVKSVTVGFNLDIIIRIGNRSINNE